MSSGRVVVVGSANRDVVVKVESLPAAGATVLGHWGDRFPGGKGANQAVAAVRAGARAELVAAVGADDAGDSLLSFLAANEVEISRLVRADQPTGAAIVVVAEDGSNAIVVIPGANAALEPRHVTGVTESRDVVLTQLEVPLETAQMALTEARRVGALGILNFSPPQPNALWLTDLADVVVVNEAELDVLEHRATLDSTVLVTRGAEGIEIRTGAARAAIPARPAEVADTTGAGDCFLGVTAAWLADGAPIELAARVGCAAASLQVSRRGAAPAMPYRHEIVAHLQ